MLAWLLGQARIVLVCGALVYVNVLLPVLLAAGRQCMCIIHVPQELATTAENHCTEAGYLVHRALRRRLLWDLRTLHMCVGLRCIVLRPGWNTS